MSTRIMADVWPLQMPPTQKSVLISLADNANDSGHAWPSIDTICERTCFGRTAVIDAIKWLETEGYLVADRSNGRRTSYQIVVTNQSGKRTGDQYAKRTGTANGPVRQTDPTSPAGGLNQSARRTLTVNNRNEPSLKELAQQGRTRSPRGSRIPDQFPTDLELTFCKQDRPDLDPIKVADSFRDYWLSVAGSRGVKLDWPATWRNWVRNQKREYATQLPRANPAAQRRSDVIAQLTGQRTSEIIDVTSYPARIG